MSGQQDFSVSKNHLLGVEVGTVRSIKPFIKVAQFAKAGVDKTVFVEAD
jgi:hypothetical protein